MKDNFKELDDALVGLASGYGSGLTVREPTGRLVMLRQFWVLQLLIKHKITLGVALWSKGSYLPWDNTCLCTTALLVCALQVVIIAAGYDTRAYRLSKPGVRFYEIDLPHASTHKQDLVRKLLPANKVCVDLDISSAGVGDRGWLEGWLGCLLCLGGSERPCNTCLALPCICIKFPQSFSLIHLHMRHRQPHTFQQAPPPATSPMRDMPSACLCADCCSWRARGQWRPMPLLPMIQAHACSLVWHRWAFWPC